MKHYIFAVIIAMTLFFLSIYFLAYDFLISFVQFLVILFSCTMTISAITLIVSISLISREKIKILQAQRKKEEKEASVTVVTAPVGHQVYIRDTDHTATVRPLHLMPGYSNSKPMHSSEDEQRWRQYHSKPIKTIEALALPESIEQQQSLYDIMELYPHLLIVGSTGSGKTTQINLAISRRLEQYPDASIYWLSTHANLDTPHPSSKVSQQIDDIQSVFRKIFREYEHRRDTAEIGEHIIVALDEWPELIDEINGLGNILRRLSRGGRKCAISLILASHGSNVTDLDIKGHSSVKQDFAEIILKPNLTQQGKAIWRQWNKVSSEIEILLPQRRDMARQLTKSGMSKNKAAMSVYGRGYGGDLVGKF